MRRRIHVCFFGEEFDSKELCEISGVNSRTFRDRWTRAGKPYDITACEEILSRRGCPGNVLINIISGDDVMQMNINDAAKHFCTTTQTVRSRIAKFGHNIQLEKMYINRASQEWARGRGKSSNDIRETNRPTAKPRVDFSPGWAERKYFPNAGANGFCKSEKLGPNAHSDRGTLLTILNGD